MPSTEAGRSLVDELHHPKGPCADPDCWERSAAHAIEAEAFAAGVAAAREAVAGLDTFLDGMAHGDPEPSVWASAALAAIDAIQVPGETP